MKTLAALMLLSLPGSLLTTPQPRPLVEKALDARAVPHGKWYLAETGHAVYCYGPVMMVKQPEGGLQRVATFCKGDKAMVPLKD
jgi:hypothetical protein